MTVYRQTQSTQSLARQLVGQPGDHAGHVIIADEQAAGRGRLGRRWTAAEGDALLLTAITSNEGATVDRLSIGAAVAIAEAVEPLLGRPVQFRWPNDVLIDGRKLAGVLIDRVGAHALIGVGLNVHGHPQSLDGDGHTPLAPATDLHEAGAPVDRLLVLDRLLHALDAALTQPADALANAWRKRSGLHGRRITASSGGRDVTGEVVDLDPQHGLLLRNDHGAIVVLPAATTSLSRVV